MTLFSPRQAYIFFLEAWARVVCAAAFSDIFRIDSYSRDPCLCFIDSAAAKRTLI